MKSRRKKPKYLQIVNLWKTADVYKAVPYLRSVVGSLREHWVEMLSLQREGERQAKYDQPDRRKKLMANQDWQAERRRAQERLESALDELSAIDVFPVDMVNGVAVIPFRKDDDLAWFVFDLFHPRGLAGWRYDSDSAEQCRALSLLEEAA